ncbi:MAG: tRNA (adenosine(37)-N6)-dimethylallyltransferase MiaA [Candidatus Muiribacteriota bacterium]
MASKKKIIIICGPTASGKTSLALDIARLFSGEIISADSMQIYQYMDIGTAKASISERLQIKHHMIDIIKPSCPQFDVMDFVKRADKIIQSLYQKNKIPVIAGGTGFYINSLLKRLPQFTIKDAEIRNKYYNIYEHNGKEHIYNYLKKVWPQRALNLHMNDIKRVIRSLEIYEAGYKNEFDKTSFEYFYEPLIFYLDLDRDILRQRIKLRVDKMFRLGMLEEVEYILKKFNFSSQARQAIGYKETLEFFEKDKKIRGIPSLKEDIILHTAQFAKRQRTYFKNKLKKMIFLDLYDINKYKIKKYLNEFINGG